MNDSTFDKLKQFIVDRIGVYEDEVTPYSRLYDDLGIYGDDATELLIEYGKRFNVDVSKFMAADYFKGEGIDLIGGLLRLFAGKRWGHNHKVLTVKDLEKGINAGRLDEEVIAGTNNRRNWQKVKNDLQQTYLRQPVPTPSEWLLLRIVDAQPGWANDYRLKKLMAKTDLFASFYDVLHALVKKGWLETKDPDAQVREYFATSEGKELLVQGYRTEDIKDYVMAIEPTGANS